MHSVAAFFASIITFVSGFFAPTVASNSPVNVQTTQPAAAAAAQAEIAGNLFNDPAAASAVMAASAAAPAPTPPPAQTIVNQPVIERIIERIVPQGAATVSIQTLAAILADFEQSISSRIAALDPPKAVIPEQVAAAGNATGAFFPASQRIDQITNTAINTPTITGGTISGASVSGYLPLHGGALTGTLSGTDLNLSGVLTAGTLSVAGVSSGGAVFAPYFSATSTTATSTFAGGLTGPGNFVVQQGSGRVGIGTTSPSELLHVSGSGLPIIKLESTSPLGSEPRVDILGRDDVGATMWGFFGLKGGGGAGTTAVVSGAITAHDYFLKTNNAIRVAIKANTGFVGIGTTTPWGKLSIKGSGTGTGLGFVFADSANTPRFVIQDNGNVGIGTTSPSARLDVGGYGTNELGFAPNNAIRLFDNYNGVSDISIKNINTNITAASAFQAFDSGGSYVSLTMPGTGNTAAPLFGLARASTTYLFSNTVGANPARNLAIGTLGANSLTFGTNNAARMTFDATGNVGIGTTSPFRKFEIAGSSGESSGGPIVALYATNGFTNARRFSIQNGVDATSNYLGFNVENDAGAVASTPLTIRTSGNVGIGTTTPWGKLSITGSGTGTGLAFAVADSANTPRFVVQDNGNVGVGTANPTHKLDLGTSFGRKLALYEGGNDFYGLGVSSGGNVEFYIQDDGDDAPAMVISSTGNVGIGTTTPGALLSANGNILGAGTLALTGTTGTTTIASGQGFTIGSSQFVVQQGSGNVGIGTASPVARLSVQAVNGRYLRLGTASSFNDYIQQDTNRFGWLAYTGLYIQSLDLANSRMSIGAGGSAPLSTLDVLGNLAVGSYAGTAAAPSNGLIVSGNVGIGTTSPVNKFEVADGNGSSVESDGSYLRGSYGGGVASRYRFTLSNNLGITGADNASCLMFVGGDSVQRTGIAAPGDDLALYTGGTTNTNMSERLRITSGGNVGIGTTTPWGKLSITGSGTGTGLAFAVADSANSPKFVIQDNGNVGIGTASLGSAVSDAPLNVVTNADNGIKISRSDMGGSQYLALYATSSPTTPYGNVISSVNNDLSLYTQFRQFFTAGGGGWGSAFEYGVATPMSSTVGGTFFNAAVTYAPSSGTGTFYGTNLSTTLNQSGSAAQNYTGLNVNVIETSFLGSDGRLLDVQKNNSSVFVVKNSGNIGIGTTTPTAQLSTTGTVRFSNFGAGTLTTDASGNLSVSSDERLKNIDVGFTRGLADVVKLSPIQYHWNTTSGLDTSTQYAGFSAQNVQAAIPEAVGSSTNGYLTLQDRPLIAALVNAVKEIAQRLTDLAERVVTKEIVATNGRFDRLCVGSTCVTEEQFMAMVAAAGQTAGIPSASAPAGTPQAPIIELNGNASSTIALGDTYNDLGARIIAPESDLNLGIVVLLDGATTTQASIDTDTPGEHTILYTVTSPTTGLTCSVMRTVVISPATQSPELPANDDPFNAAPANDNASTTISLAI